MSVVYTVSKISLVYPLLIYEYITGSALAGHACSRPSSDCAVCSGYKNTGRYTQATNAPVLHDQAIDQQCNALQASKAPALAAQMWMVVARGAALEARLKKIEDQLSKATRLDSHAGHEALQVCIHLLPLSAGTYCALSTSLRQAKITVPELTLCVRPVKGFLPHNCGRACHHCCYDWMYDGRDAFAGSGGKADSCLAGGLCPAQSG